MNQSRQIKLYHLCLLIFLAGCSRNSKFSGAAEKHLYSKYQLRLSAINDSLVAEFSKAKSPVHRQLLLMQYQQRLDDYLTHHAMDSMRVTIDEALVNGRAVMIKSHYSKIQFQYTLTFSGKMSPTLDSVFAFMKGLKQGDDTLVNLEYTMACLVNSPDSGYLPVFKIYAFPIPLQYTKK